MRDILITVVILSLLLFILRRPRVGAYVWAWLSMMNPHRAAFGFSRNIPFSHLVAVSTLVSFLISRDRHPFPVNSISITQVFLLIWMSFTSFFAVNTSDIVFERWIFVFKIQLMLIVTMMLIRGREQIIKLVWVVTVSIAFYGVKGGIWTLLGGGGGRVWGPAGSMIEDNNALGLSLVMLVPFMYFLLQVSAKRWIRTSLAFSIAATCFAILGSQSRGALLALVGMAFMLALKGKRPIQMSILLTTLIGSAVLFMPESWTNRMGTISDYQGDSSAMSRLYAWKTMWSLAVDRPFVGGGFVSDNPVVYSLYAPATVGNYEGGAIFVAHSIYFQALGEHGFPGLLLYLLLGFFTWKKATQIAKKTENTPELKEWVPLLMKMTQVSLIGFSVGGAFLSLMYFDLPYYIVAFVVLVDATLREQEKTNQITAESLGNKIVTIP